MDRRAHSKRLSLMQFGAGLLCVLICLVSGCQQVTKQPAETGCDPELTELAASLSAGEPNMMGAVLPDKTALVASGAATKAGPAAPAVVKAAAATKPEAAGAAAAPAAVAPAAAAVAPAAAAQSAPAASEAAPAAGGAAGAPAATVPKEGEPAKAVGPETMEGTSEPGTGAEPKEEVKPAELTAIIIGGKEIVISEPAPLKTFGFASELKGPSAGLETTPLAAPTAVETTPVVSEPAAVAEGEAEGGGKFTGLLGMGRAAIGYAGEHYIVLGSMAVATPAVLILARRRKVWRRPFRKVSDD